MVPCMGTVTWPEPVPGHGVAGARLGRPRPAAGTGAGQVGHPEPDGEAPAVHLGGHVALDGGHLVVAGRRRAGVDRLDGRSLRSSVSSTHLVEWVLGEVGMAQDGDVGRDGGGDAGDPGLPRARNMRRRADSRSGAQTISLAIRLS